jgi:uracil-DNA glycosylase family 4
VSDNAQLLDQLKADILKQNICPELAETATQLVMGHGNAQADVVFIGEAPGKNEDLQGIPFVGAAGKFLDQMLAAAHLQRGDIYITNIVKYRPPSNRDPKPEEKRAFWPFLVRELQIIQPRIIVTLGRHSMEYFLPNAKISEVHGKPKRVTFGDIKLVVLPLYHPAAALYNGDLKATLLEDFATIPAVQKLLLEEGIGERS